MTPVFSSTLAATLPRQILHQTLRTFRTKKWSLWNRPRHIKATHACQDEYNNPSVCRETVKNPPLFTLTPPGGTKNRQHWHLAHSWMTIRLNTNVTFLMKASIFLHWASEFGTRPHHPVGPGWSGPWSHLRSSKSGGKEKWFICPASQTDIPRLMVHGEHSHLSLGCGYSDVSSRGRHGTVDITGRDDWPVTAERLQFKQSRVWIAHCPNSSAWVGPESMFGSRVLGLDTLHSLGGGWGVSEENK